MIVDWTEIKQTFNTRMIDNGAIIYTSRLRLRRRTKQKDCFVPCYFPWCWHRWMNLNHNHWQTWCYLFINCQFRFLNNNISYLLSYYFYISQFIYYVRDFYFLTVMCFQHMKYPNRVMRKKQLNMRDYISFKVTITNWLTEKTCQWHNSIASEIFCGLPTPDGF